MSDYRDFIAKDAKRLAEIRQRWAETEKKRKLLEPFTRRQFISKIFFKNK